MKEQKVIYKLIVPGPIEDVEEIRVLEWHRRVGMAVEAGDLLVELETNKAIVEIRPTHKGFLRQLLVSEGEWQALGSVLALYSETPDEPLPDGLENVGILPVEFTIV
jgi:pyruvate/2-oxoglutarate dehydrogenase complex dihydrolipoamide acyltransferase (E2) component